ncbi:MAG: helix-turn-helix domain-containing protein [Verrucomicrobia bacterium]|nr:helix-turn-helix domain-containing protein [Verrucomicrobiota bacterium]
MNEPAAERAKPTVVRLKDKALVDQICAQARDAILNNLRERTELIFWRSSLRESFSPYHLGRFLGFGRNDKLDFNSVAKVLAHFSPMKFRTFDVIWTAEDEYYPAMTISLKEANEWTDVLGEAWEGLERPPHGLSESSGLAISAVTRYLCGQYLPREQSLTKIAQALGVPEADISAKFPPLPPIDATIVARNIRTLCWERGLHPAAIAKKAGVDPGTVINYSKSETQRPDRGVLTKIAVALGLNLAEIMDPTRSALQITPFYRTNLDYLLRGSGLSVATISKRCGLNYRQLGKLLSGDEPNPVQVARLARHFSLTSRQLLMEDLSGKDSLPAGANRTGAEGCENAPLEATVQPA